MGGTVSVLGVIRHVSDDGAPTELSSSGQRRLLAALTLAQGRPVRAETLSDMLGSAPSALRTSMSRLRARLGEPVIETDGSGYRLTATVDAWEFERLLATPGTIAQRLASLEQALALWGGDAFDEFCHEPWVEAEAIRLNELRLVALEDRAELLIASRRSGEAVAELGAHVALNPLRDRAGGLLVQALAASGRQADALRSYEQYRSLLAEETGTEPSARVKQIEQRVAAGTSDEVAEARRRAIASGLVLTKPPEPDPETGSGRTDQTDNEPSLPSGLLTFLFTDIEASTRRWENAPEQMRRALAQHDDIIDRTVGTFDGVVFKHTGDGVGAVFTSPVSAAEAAIEMQRGLQAATWENGDRLKIRIGLHLGDASPTRGDYFGAPVSRAARIMDVANGDQIVLSSTLGAFLDRIELRSMGEHQLRGIGTEAIQLVVAPDLVVDERPLRSRVGGTRALPIQPHGLIGRDVEVKELTGLLDNHHAVTLVGPGGVGKTSLAVAVGHAIAPRFSHGVVMCELAELSDPDAVPEAVAEALGARAQPGMSLSESIVNYLEDRRLLLIMDNCEHVIDAVRELGRDVLALNSSCILATSREPIGLPAEQLFGLSPLHPSTDGVELFLLRATEREHGFAPSKAELATIATICERLDGIPLGIELAAAWVRVLSPAQLLERLHDRFRVLRGGRAGSRHQTLRDTVLWSYEQLDGAQTTLFNRLSVFSGGFALDAAEAVCTDDELVTAADVLDLLMALVDKSMVASVRGVGHIRFTMLGTLRQFGQEQLVASGESDRYRRRHGEYFRDLAATGSAMLISDDEADVWAMFDREWSNLRGAFETLLAAGDLDSVTELVLELGWYAILSMRFELFSWVEELFSAHDIDAHANAASFYGLRAVAAYFTVDSRSADYAEHGLELDATDPHGYCRVALSSIALNNDLSAEVSANLTSSWLEHVTDDSPMVSRLWAEGMRTFHLCANEPSPSAATHARVLTEIAESTHSATAAGVAFWAGGMVASFDGIDGALDHWRQGIDSVQSLSEVHLVRDLIVGLVLHFTVARGDLDEAIDGALGALERAQAQHYLAGTSHLFGVTAVVLCRTGRSEIAAQLLGAMVGNGHLPRRNAVVAVEQALGQQDAVAARARGTGLTINEAAAVALAALRDAREERADPS